MLRLSQGQLTLLDYCPRRFQHSILDSLAVPPSPELLAGRQWGDRFHLLMQQREMGLSIDTVLAQDAELQACLATLMHQAPALLTPQGEAFRQSEHSRSLKVNGYWFTVVYDLLRQWGDRAEIIDWKTYLKPKDIRYLYQDWQTRLYLYVLAETSPLEPSQIAMTYWFVRAQNPATGTVTPQQVRISYSDESHEKARQDLQTLTDQLTDWLAADEPLPQLKPGNAHCSDCPFAVRCQRGEAARSPDSPVPTLEEIEEVAV